VMGRSRARLRGGTGVLSYVERSGWMEGGHERRRGWWDSRSLMRGTWPLLACRRKGGTSRWRGGGTSGCQDSGQGVEAVLTEVTARAGGKGGVLPWPSLALLPLLYCIYSPYWRCCCCCCSPTPPLLAILQSCSYYPCCFCSVSCPGFSTYCPVPPPVSSPCCLPVCCCCCSGCSLRSGGVSDRRW
jgi:hypothetical protein